MRVVERAEAGGLASDDLDVTDKRTAKVHHVGCCGSERAGFEPEHFVHSVVLSTNQPNAISPREGTHFQQRHIRDQTQWPCDSIIQHERFCTINL